MTIKRKYKCTMENTQYLFGNPVSNGKAAQFIRGEFLTDVPEEIKELDEQIAKGIPHIYVDPNDAAIDTGLIDFVREAQIKATKEAMRIYEEAQKTGKLPDPVIVVAEPAKIEGQAAADAVKSGAVSGASPATVSNLLAGLNKTPQTVVSSTGIASTANAPQAGQSNS